VVVKISELSISLRKFARTFRWRKLDRGPGARLRSPIDESRVALVSSAGLVVPGDDPFDQKTRGGDYSHRVIPADVELQSLEEHHRSDSFDHSGIGTDSNLALPLDRLRELAAVGEIGEVAPRHVSLMGSITAPSRLVKRTIPLIVDLLVADRVDIALMVPV